MNHNEQSLETQTTNTQDSPAPSPADALEGVLTAGKSAWEQTREARRAVTREQLAPQNFDVNVANIVMRAAYGRVLPFRAQISEELPKIDLRSLDMLPTYCAAMLYGDDLFYVRKTRRPPREVNAEAEKLWRRLVDRLTVIAEDGLFPAGVLEEVRASAGWKGRANGLSRMATLAFERWSAIENRTTLTRADLNRAIALSDELRAHFGSKGAPVVRSALELERSQAIALAYNAYEDVRRAMAHLRWREGDAHRYAPSVHRNALTMRSRRGGATAEDFDKADPAPGAGTKSGKETGAKDAKG